MQIEPILQEIEDAGLKVLNLFQLGDLWQANLYDGEKAWTFGSGDSPSAALSIALENALMTPGYTISPRVAETLLDNLF